MAGNGEVQGVAPEAQLLDMKVFSNSDDPRLAGASTDAIVDAIEDSVKLGADILNLSLGSDVITVAQSLDPVAIALNKASDLGVVPVVAAGNSGRASAAGSDTHTIQHNGNPEEDTSLGNTGLATGAITVGAMEGTLLREKETNITVDGQVIASQVGVVSNAGIPDDFWQRNLTFTQFYKFKDGAIDASATLPATADVFNKSWLSGGLNVTDGQANGDVVICSRGNGISFKAMQAAAANKHWAGLIIIDNVEEPLLQAELDPVHTYTDGDTQQAVVPTFIISKKDGEKLYQTIKTSNDADYQTANNFSLSVPQEVTVDNPYGQQMSSFTSWGTTSDLQLKPDITGVGGNVWSLKNDNGYQQMSGTSMASPFVAGSVALLKQVANQKHLNLGQGTSSFVKNVKTLLQNTAKPVYDAQNQTYYSPRQEGAGLVQVAKAVALSAKLSDAKDNDGVVDLKAFTTRTQTFTVKLQNTTAKSHTYHLDNYGGVATEVLVDDKALPNTIGLIGEYSENEQVIEGVSSINANGVWFNRDETEFLKLAQEKKIAGASVAADNSTITLAPNQTKTLKITLTLPESFQPQNWVEGYLGFKVDKETATSISIPYFGYFGDWNQSPLLDKPANEKGSVHGWSYLSQHGTYSENVPAAAQVLADPLMTEAQKAQLAHHDYFTVEDKPAAFSYPKADHTASVGLLDDYEYLNRPAKLVEFDVLDSSGKKILRHLNSFHDVQKGLLIVTWDGKVASQTTGQLEKLPDGDYQIRCQATSFDGKKVETVTHAVQIDNVAPSFENLQLTQEGDEFYLSGSYKETGGAGMFTVAENPYLSTTFSVNGALKSFNIGSYFNRKWQEQVTYEVSESDWVDQKRFKVKLTPAQIKTLKPTDNSISIEAQDRAFNTSDHKKEFTSDLDVQTPSQNGLDINHRVLVDYHKMNDATVTDRGFEGLDFFDHPDFDWINVGIQAMIGDDGQTIVEEDKPLVPKTFNAFDLKLVDEKTWQITLDGTAYGYNDFYLQAKDIDGKDFGQKVPVTVKDNQWQATIQFENPNSIHIVDAEGKDLVKPMVPQVNPDQGNRVVTPEEQLAKDNGGEWVTRGEGDGAEQILVVPNETSELKVSGQVNGQTASKLFIYNNQILQATKNGDSKFPILAGLPRFVNEQSQPLMDSGQWGYYNGFSRTDINDGKYDDVYATYRYAWGDNDILVGNDFRDGAGKGNADNLAVAAEGGYKGATQLDANREFKDTIKIYDAEELSKYNYDYNVAANGLNFPIQYNCQEINFVVYDPISILAVEKLGIQELNAYGVVNHVYDTWAKYSNYLGHFAVEHSFYQGKIKVYRLPKGKTLDDVKKTGKTSDPIIEQTVEEDLKDFGLDDNHPISLLNTDNVAVDAECLFDDKGQLVYYNPFTRQYTIIGGILPDKVKNLRIVLNNANPDDPSNKVTINADGSFTFVANNVDPYGAKQFEVRYDLVNGQTTEAKVDYHTIIVDLNKPSIWLNPNITTTYNPWSKTYEIYTTNSKFDLGGTLFTLSGASVYANGEEIFRGRDNSNAFDSHNLIAAGLAPEKFNKTYTLTKGTNIFNVQAAAHSGMGLTSDPIKIVVHYK